jgi:hypothetical protein
LWTVILSSPDDDPVAALQIITGYENPRSAFGALVRLISTATLGFPACSRTRLISAPSAVREGTVAKFQY